MGVTLSVRAPAEVSMRMALVCGCAEPADNVGLAERLQHHIFAVLPGKPRGCIPEFIRPA